MTAGAAPNETVGNFEIVQGGKMELFVTDKAGQNSQERFTAPIHLLLDDRPVVRIVEPPPVSLATPSAALPVVIDAEDDYGISSMEIYRSLNESRPTPETAAVPTPPPTRLAQPLTLPLSQYGLQPGDVIKLFARVQDNDPAGAKGTESDVVVVQIISDADFRRMMMSRQGLEVLQSKYQQARRRLESLAEEMKELEEELASQTPNDPTAREMREKLASLGQKMQEQAEAIHESAKNDLPLELDEKLRKELEKLGEELAKSASNMGELAEGKKSNEEARRKLEELRKKLDEQKREFDQNAMEPIEHFSKIFPLKQDESRFVQIYQRQRALEERMKSLKGQDLTGDPNVKARMRELEAEQRQIREALNDLLTDIENHAASLPDDPKLDKLRTQASEFAKAVRECNAGNNMTDAEAALAEFLGTRAHSNALAAADALEQFLSKCQSMGSEGKQCLSFQPGLGTSMSTSADQLLGMMGLSNGNNMGSGYSMNQNTPNNVGLYGNLPLAGDPRSGRGGDQQAGSGNGRSVGRGDRQNYWWLRGTDDGRAMGVGEEIVPVQYRRRVGQYFQRLADEVATPNSKSNSN
ncbi:MAG: hypothetical protein IPK83_18460 [Planctomycetes bacterium]|nr:hypothetical protein [Planctomycetota bacterium]